jgi:hypothetical protein
MRLEKARHQASTQLRERRSTCASRRSPSKSLSRHTAVRGRRPESRPTTRRTGCAPSRIAYDGTTPLCGETYEATAGVVASDRARPGFFQARRTREIIHARSRTNASKQGSSHSLRILRPDHNALQDVLDAREGHGVSDRPGIPDRQDDLRGQKDQRNALRGALIASDAPFQVVWSARSCSERSSRRASGPLSAWPRPQRQSIPLERRAGSPGLCHYWVRRGSANLLGLDFAAGDNLRRARSRTGRTIMVLTYRDAASAQAARAWCSTATATRSTDRDRHSPEPGHSAGRVGGRARGGA